MDTEDEMYIRSLKREIEELKTRIAQLEDWNEELELRSVEANEWKEYEK